MHLSTGQTTQGVLVTVEEAKGMIVEEVNRVRAREAEKKCKEDDPPALLDPSYLPKRAARLDFSHWAMEHRARHYGKARVLPPPLKVCMAIAKSHSSNAAAEAIERPNFGTGPPEN